MPQDCMSTNVTHVKLNAPCLECYDPPQFFSSLSDPLLVTLSMPKRPLPLNPSSLPDLPPLPPSEPSKPSSPLGQPPVEPLVRCFALATMQVPLPTDWDLLPTSLAVPATVGKCHKTAPASCQPAPHTSSLMLHYSALVWVCKLLDI